MSDLSAPPSWRGSSPDPNEEQFGDVVVPVDGPQEATDFDAVLVGEPFDRAVLGRRGASRGPRAIRAALAPVATHHVTGGAVRAVADAGDVTVGDGGATDAPTPNRRLQRRVEAVTERFHAADVTPVFLGGDNSLTVPNAAPALDRGSLGCVSFDAHLDVRAVRGDATSGTPYRQLFEAGLDAYVCVGARHFETSTAYHEYVHDRGGTVVTATEAGADPEGAVDRALAAMDGIEQVYVSLDLDVLDATAAPGVSAPTPGGLSTRDLFRMLRLAASDDRVAGVEVVECAPPLDRGDRTVRAAARAVAHALSGVVGGGSE